MKKPNQGTEIVGKKPAWELWAESQIKLAARADQLREMGAFTSIDLAKKTGWTQNKCRNYLHKSALKHELAQDPTAPRNAWVRFYFPPK